MSVLKYLSNISLENLFTWREMQETRDRQSKIGLSRKFRHRLHRRINKFIAIKCTLEMYDRNRTYQRKKENLKI